MLQQPDPSFLTGHFQRRVLGVKWAIIHRQHLEVLEDPHGKSLGESTHAKLPNSPILFECQNLQVSIIKYHLQARPAGIHHKVCNIKLQLDLELQQRSSCDHETLRWQRSAG